ISGIPSAAPSAEAQPVVSAAPIDTAAAPPASAESAPPVASHAAVVPVGRRAEGGSAGLETVAPPKTKKAVTNTRAVTQPAAPPPAPSAAPPKSGVAGGLQIKTNYP